MFFLFFFCYSVAVTVQIHGSPACHMCEYAMNEIVAAAVGGTDMRSALTSVCNQLDSPSEVGSNY